MLVITLPLLATCPVSSKCSVTHVQWGALTQCCFNDGPHFQRSGNVETVLFQCITLITFGILDQTSPNLQGSRRNGCEWCVRMGIISKKKKKKYWVYVAVVLVITLPLLATCPVSSKCSVTHVQWGALTQCCFNDGPHFQRSGNVETVLFQCITLITFGILDQTSPNLQGSRRNGCEWCVQN